MKQIFINEQEAKVIIELSEIIEDERNMKTSQPIKFTNHYKNLLLKINKFIKNDIL